ncbi:pyruvate carboxylase [Desulfovibrio sp. OttesenSCG-928-G11]|nr:pyruvate carboxylase [Desulfovibrio sp. OttesenSCG-928-G11]
MGIKSFEHVVRDLKGKAILVANRGIPARRICRSIRERFDAVAVMTATDIDKTAPAASSAQELLLLGPEPTAYLDVGRIVQLAKQRDIVAIHPGWGFASEDESFPRICTKAGLVFIGSTAESMNLLGNKVQVRKIAKQLKIPVVPGSDGAVDVPAARRAARKIGFPIMLKAEGGGGGRGIFEVHNEADLEDAFLKASTMAQASFGNPRIYVEKYLTNVRHIEIQVIADQYGNIFAFDERDCSIQRNNQKLIEITPSPWPGMTEKLRAQLKKYSRALVREVGYSSLCTVEFLITEEGTPYLIEVNTRLQVEHGITECRYGIDLVEEQIAVAFGSRLRFEEGSLKPVHAAMQVRINCEDPQKNFSPNAGLVTRYVSPGGPGVRLDSNLSAGYEFPSNYDSAGSLLITYGQDWTKVLGIMERALSEYVVGGVKTTIPFYRQIIAHPRFRRGDCDTRFISMTPELMDYTDLDPEAERNARLIAEISARGYNPFVQLGEYRTKETPRLPRHEVALPDIAPGTLRLPSPYPRDDNRALLDFIRDSNYVHFCDTTCRDNTQSNSGNRFRLAEDLLIAPYLDNCNFFSLESGGGAHFHVNMLANMTSPFYEAREFNRVAPKTMKQILIRSTNVLGYKPQPKNLMRATAEKICEEYHVIRSFDFLNHIDNMRPFAEVALHTRGAVFQPAISLTPGRGFSVDHYLGVAAEIVSQSAKILGLPAREAARRIILGLKDMAGNCPPRMMRDLVQALRKKWPDLVLHYHRHYTDGLFIPAVGEAAKAGAHILDVSLGAGMRWYGQGEVLSTAAYLEDELGLKSNLNKGMVRDGNFVLKQIMPYYDRYTAPYFQGIDYDVVSHGMPGGATSSSQEGALKQGYIHLLPYMLRYLTGTRKVVLYHDVTPGSQITWNTAFLAVTSAFKRGGEHEVRYLLEILDHITRHDEEQLSPEMKEARLAIYQDCNDAFRDLLLGKFGKLPLGFPPDWVYRSAFGADWKRAVAARTEKSPLESLPDTDMDAEHAALAEAIHRQPGDEEFLMFLNHPADAIKTIEFRQKYGNPNNLPLAVWFEGLNAGEELNFTDSKGKPHHLSLIRIQNPGPNGVSVVRYVLDSEIMSCEVQVFKPETGAVKSGGAMADPDNAYHVGAPSNGDLWVMYVHPGDMVKKGEELFNISIMKQEKAVIAPMDAMVKRVLKTADYRHSKQMVPVREGELIVELAPAPLCCPNPKCGKALPAETFVFCPYCGKKTGI